MNGKITNVTDRVLGSELDGDHASGVTTLTVIDVDDFEPEGGNLKVGAETIAYTAVDDETNEITLDSATSDSHSDGDRVELSPRGTERTAWVDLSALDEDESLPAIVPLHLYERVPLGLRDLEAGTGEDVEVDYVGNELQVFNVVGEGEEQSFTETPWVSKDVLEDVGDLIVGGPDPERLAVGTDDQVLVADSGETLGLKWAPVPTGGFVLASEFDTKGDLLAGTGADTYDNLPVGTDGQILYADSGEATGLLWDDPPSGSGGIPETLIDAKGDLIVGDADDSAARLAVGTDGQILYADSGEATGLLWDDPPVGGGGSLTVATTVAGLGGSPGNGDMGLIRAGSSPYDFIFLIYDSTYGKWVSAFPGLNNAKTQAAQTTTSTTYVSMTGNEQVRPWLPWKVLDDAGLKIQVRNLVRVRNTSNAGATNSFGVQVIGAEVNSGDLNVQGSEFAVVTATGTGLTIQDSGWTDLPGGLTINALIEFDMRFKTTAGTAEAREWSILTRWVGTP